MTDLVRVTEVLAPWNPYHNEEAMERGRLVHLYTAVHASCKMGITPSGLEGYIESFDKWFQKCVSETILFEQRFFDSKLGITGQIDLLFRFHGKKHLTLGDYKTGTPTKSWPIQLAPYKRLVEQAGYKVDECGNIMLHESGKMATWRPMGIPENQAWSIFLSCLNAYRYYGGKNGRQPVQD